MTPSYAATKKPSKTDVQSCRSVSIAHLCCWAAHATVSYIDYLICVKTTPIQLKLQIHHFATLYRCHQD